MKVLAAIGGPAIFDDLPTGLTYRQLGRNMNIIRLHTLCIKTHIYIFKHYIDLETNIWLHLVFTRLTSYTLKLTSHP
jgi:hypothetical protein